MASSSIINNGALGGRAFSSPSGRHSSSTSLQHGHSHNHNHVVHHHHHHPSPVGAASSSTRLHGGVAIQSGLSNSASSTVSDEFSEIKAVTLEWRLSNLKQIFDSSRGDAKSRCIKSAPFGEGRWEVYFYANSGSDYVSLYLSAEPTPEERELGSRLARSTSGTHSRSASGVLSPGSLASQQQQQQSLSANPPPTSTSTSSPWVRDGSYRFIFEIRPYVPASGKPGSSSNNTNSPASSSHFPPIKTMEAADHVFSHEARNWGWQSFARRNDVYYNNSQAKISDTFIVACTITYSPNPPSPPTPSLVLGIRRKLVPTQLTDAFASLFDDPVYSDVKFVIRSRSARTGKYRTQSLYAIRKILSSRAEYFAIMFSSGFSEGRTLPGLASDDDNKENVSDWEQGDSDISSVESDDELGLWESAEEEEEQEEADEEEEEEEDSNDEEQATAPHTTIEEEGTIRADGNGDEEGAEEEGQQEDITAKTLITVSEHQAAFTNENPLPVSRTLLTNEELATEAKPLRPPSQLTSTMRSVSTVLRPTPDSVKPFPRNVVSEKNKSKETKRGEGKRHIEIVVKDAAYSTYKALLYYLYTDIIAFAPLSSTYQHARDTAEARNEEFPYSCRRTYFKHHPCTTSPIQPSVPLPDLTCSSKAIYKLADKLNMPELKNRAFEHIVQSLNDIETIPYEAFSQFSNQFEEVRNVVSGLMLAHWNEIRNGQALKNIFRLVRQDPERFPAFEEVWEYIIMNLEYKPPVAGVRMGGDVGDDKS